jgi:cell division septation protein DedD
MATSASRSRLFPARSRKSYRLEMESRTLYLLLSLMALTGVVIFYLGMVTGKALRDPNAPVALTAPMTAPAAKDDAAAKPGALAFNEALKGDPKTVEGLKVESQSTAQRTDELLKAATRQIELKEVPPASTPAPSASMPAPAAKPAAPALASAPKAPPPRAARPAAVAPSHPAAPARPAPAAAAPAADDGQYTVQVFSSKHQDSAQQLVEKLRSQGFGAYLNRYQASDNEVWYRVRVGRTDHAGAEALQSRLKNEAKLKNPQIQKL